LSAESFWLSLEPEKGGDLLALSQDGISPDRGRRSIVRRCTVASQGEEKRGLDSVRLSEAEIVPSVRAITEALCYCFERFGESAKEDVADTLGFKSRERGLDKHLEKYPGANREFVRQAFLEIIGDLESDAEAGD
jgi:hypothetical protein